MRKREIASSRRHERDAEQRVRVDVVRPNRDRVPQGLERRFGATQCKKDLAAFDLDRTVVFVELLRSIEFRKEREKPSVVRSGAEEDVDLRFVELHARKADDGRR